VQVDWFASEDHRSFEYPGNGSGALMLHGFMGTPKELRPIGRELAQEGFHVYGPVLPGFGERISALGTVGRADWIGEASQLWAEIYRDGRPGVLFGFSMGAAVALHLAHTCPPDRLILVAPLWKVMGGDWKLKLLPVLKHVIRRVKPFSRTDFNDPGVRQFFESALPELDIDDPEVQQALRKHVELPTQTIDELRRLAIDSGEIASEVNVPTLVIQGTDDLTVRASDTRELVSRIGNNARLEELSGGHLLVSDQERSWQEMRTIVREFVDGGLP
jgi:carboxylesterase